MTRYAIFLQSFSHRTLSYNLLQVCIQICLHPINNQWIEPSSQDTFFIFDHRLCHIVEEKIYHYFSFIPTIKIVIQNPLPSHRQVDQNESFQYNLWKEKLMYLVTKTTDTLGIESLKSCFFVESLVVDCLQLVHLDLHSNSNCKACANLPDPSGAESSSCGRWFRTCFSCLNNIL